MKVSCLCVVKVSCLLRRDTCPWYNAMPLTYVSCMNTRNSIYNFTSHPLVPPKMKRSARYGKTVVRSIKNYFSQKILFWNHPQAIELRSVYIVCELYRIKLKQQRLTEGPPLIILMVQIVRKKESEFEGSPLCVLQ